MPGAEKVAEDRARSPMRPVPWAFVDSAQAFALAVVCTLVLVLGAAFIRGDTPAAEAQPLTALVLLLGPALLVLAVWLFGVRRYRASWSSLGFALPGNRRSYVFAGIGLLLSLGFAAAYAATVETLGFDVLVPPAIPPGILGDGVYRVINTASIGISGPIAEETFFRGFLLPAVAPYMGAVKAVVAISALFALSHLMVGVLVPAFVSGLILSWLYLKTGSIVPPVIAHAAQNLLVLAVTP